ncbi:MAG: prepilin-type N-terminal cleavage/methylation domain-containing protein [Deferribacteraceae bacterium]|jgi:prepilin-type N-terminal cleavage/methylation domain-containing protein|nr:prepilin-type N-terminal cleavage/methylation domain-containing protein [Deferribacteraceae bacterium]
MGKGFTLVEITIVMLIIGIIAALAIKGRDLVEVANVRSELRKLEKFDLAVKTIVLKKGTSGSAAAFDKYNYAKGEEISAQFFIDNGTLDERDFLTYMVPATNRKSVWRTTLSGVESDINIVVHGSYTPQEGCMVEYIMDDMKAKTGRVVMSPFIHKGGPVELDNQTFDRCAEWINVFDNANNVTLKYRVL